MASEGTEYPIDINVSDKFGVLYTSTNPVTGYTGELSEFTFYASEASINAIDAISNTKIVWDFGDGTTAFGLSANHTYRFPGDYTVDCIVFDSDGSPHKSSKSRTVRVKNYFPDKVIWKTDSLQSNLTEVVTAGRLSDLLTIERYNSWQPHNTLSASGYTVNVYASGSNSNYISSDQYIKDKNVQFRKIWRFVKGDGNFTPIESTTTTDTELYYTVLSSPSLAGGSLTRSSSADDSAIFVGTSGLASLYYMDDSRSSQVNLFANLDTGNFSTLENEITNTPRQEYQSLGLNYFSNKPAVLPANVVSNIPTKLLITSNGIPGFNIGENKYERSPISYTISVADKDNNLIKDLNILSAGNECEYFRIEHNFNKAPWDQTTYYSNTSINYDQYGAVSFFAVVTGSTLSEYITASSVVSNDRGIFGIIGSSNTFNIWPSGGKYQIAKTSEDYDPLATMQSYIMQDTISDKSNFINWFLKEVFGDSLSDPEILGKTVYEKIDNFVENRSDIDICNVDALYSMSEMVGLDFDDYRYNFPAGIKRLVDLLSINQKRLFGFRDNSNTNFDKSGYTLSDSSLIGRNLGSIIDTSSYIVSAGTPIIANQLYGNQLKLITTMVLSADSSTYALSSYEKNWGWGLSFPNGEDVFKYYDFYTYIDNSTFALSSREVVNSVIDFANPLTTLEETDNNVTTWTQKYGTVDNMFDHRLREGLNLFNLTFSTSAELVSGVRDDDCVRPSPSVTPTVTPTATPSLTPTVTPSITPSISISPSRGTIKWEDISELWGNLSNKWNELDIETSPMPTPSITPSISITPTIGTVYWEEITATWDSISSEYGDTALFTSPMPTPSITPSISITPTQGTVYWENKTSQWESLSDNWENY